MNNPNRTKNKLRKIYSCLGINCDSKKTNGMMIDELEHKAECGEIGGSGGGTITPYAKKIYTGRGYVTALIFDHTQITGECSYTDVNGDVVSCADLSTCTTNLYLSNTDITSFELEINGSKVTINVES